jgi:hypothetical protein
MWKEINLARNTQQGYKRATLKIEGKNMDLKREIAGTGHKSWELRKLIA